MSTCSTSCPGDPPASSLSLMTPCHQRHLVDLFFVHPAVNPVVGVGLCVCVFVGLCVSVWDCACVCACVSDTVEAYRIQTELSSTGRASARQTPFGGVELSALPANQFIKGRISPTPASHTSIRASLPPPPHSAPVNGAAGIITDGCVITGTPLITA